jgi:hypothetical protein
MGAELLNQERWQAHDPAGLALCRPEDVVSSYVRVCLDNLHSPTHQVKIAVAVAAPDVGRVLHRRTGTGEG